MEHNTPSCRAIHFRAAAVRSNNKCKTTNADDASYLNQRGYRVGDAAFIINSMDNFVATGCFRCLRAYGAGAASVSGSSLRRVPWNAASGDRS